MKTKAMLISCVLVVVFMVGCGKPLEQPSTMSDVVVVTAHAPQASFPKSAHYAFMRQRPEDSDIADEDMEIIRRLRDAIKDDLKSKKYKPGKGEIDYIIDYQIVAQQNMTVLAERSQIQGSEWITVVGVPDDFVQGALVIDVIDAATLKPVWRGLCNANIALDEVDDAEKDLRARYAVQELLKAFPPK